MSERPNKGELEAAQQTAHYFESVLKASGDGIAIIDSTQTILLVNDGFGEIFGRSPQELVDTNLFDLLKQLDSEAPERWAEMERAVRSGEECPNVEFRTVSPLEARHLSVRASLVEAGGEEERGVIVTVWRDITRRKRAEDALSEGEERYRQIVENAGDVIYQTDEQGFFTLVNRLTLRRGGYSKEDLIGKHILDLIHPEYKEEAAKFYASQFANRTPETYYELPVVTKQGETIWMGQNTQLLMEGDRVVGFQSIARDITQRKETEEALRDSEQRLRALTEFQERVLSTAATAIFTVDSNKIVTGVNDEFCSMTGFREEEIVGKPCLDFAKEPCATSCPLFELAPGEQVFRRQCTILTRDGRTLTALTNAGLLTNEDGQVVGGIESFVDVTELTEAREQAEVANKTKSEFLANVSHEIRTPMNGIIGMTELALLTDLTSEQREYLESVKTSADFLLALINDLLDFAKIEAGKLELTPTGFSLLDCVSDSLNVMSIEAHRKGLGLAHYVSPRVPDAVVGDPGRLRQIIINLAGNAIKFTEKGEVVVWVDLESMTDSRACLHFAVADSGIGIPPEKRQAVFSPFEQADGSLSKKYGGTGLGLAVTSRLVEMMDGRIWVESEVNEGSTFHFTVSLDVGDKASCEPGSEESPEPSDLTAIVVDDDAGDRRVLEETLARWNVRSTAVSSGREALEAMEAACKKGEPFPVALVDVRMLEMDGLEPATRIFENSDLSQSAVIMLTSSKQEGEAARFRKLGAAGYLSKPVKESELLTAIARALERRSTGKLMPPRGVGFSPAESVRDLNILVVEDNPVNQRLAERMLETMGYTVTVTENGKEALSALDKAIFPCPDGRSDARNGRFGGHQAYQGKGESHRKTHSHSRHDRLCHGTGQGKVSGSRNGRVSLQTDKQP